MCDENLQIVEFADVNEAIEALDKYWNGFENASEIMRDVDVELDLNNEDKTWFFVNGSCDICNRNQTCFIPACAYEEGIVGVECISCENMSVYPLKNETSNEI